MTPRTRWQGWTIVEKDGGNLIIESHLRTPVLYPSKAQAESDKEPGEAIVRCELRLIKK